MVIENEEVMLSIYLKLIWKHRKLVVAITLIGVLASAAYSFIAPPVYRSQAVITPKDKDGGQGSLTALAMQMGGMTGLPIASGPITTTEIMALLKSNVLREKIIRQYNLLPVLFSDRWDGKAWKKNASGIKGLWREQTPKKGAKQGDEDYYAPSIWDGLRALDEILYVNQKIKDNVIVVSAEFEDPETSARIVEYALSVLNEHMSSEMKRVALSTKSYLEKQLTPNLDPLIRQKIYGLIVQQMETSLLSEVKENLAFKVLDPPMAPDKRFKPRRGLIILMGGIASLFMGVVVAFALDYRKRSGSASDK